MITVFQMYSISTVVSFLQFTAIVPVCTVIVLRAEARSILYKMYSYRHVIYSMLNGVYSSRFQLYR